MNRQLTYLLKAVILIIITAENASAFASMQNIGEGTKTEFLQPYFKSGIKTVRNYGARGDGIADDTKAIQEAIRANAGKGLDFEDGFVYLVSGPLLLESGSIYFGKAKIIAREGTGLINNAIMEARGVDHVVVRDLVIDCNGDNKGIGNGISLDSGHSNTIQFVHILNSLNTGIKIQSEKSARILDNTIENCGRKGYSDNHGVMIYTISTRPVTNIEVRGNKIINAFRKGVTTYSNGGLVSDIRIENNVIRNCGLGGIYIGGVASPVQTGITVSNNTISECYQNIAVYKTNDVTIEGNVLRNSTGGDGMNLSGINNGEISNNHIEGSAATGLNVIHTTGVSSDLRILKNRVINSNRLRSGYAPGINLSAVSRSVISDNQISDTGKLPLTTFGIYEQPGSDDNIFRDNTVGDMSAGKIVVSGKGSTRIR